MYMYAYTQSCRYEQTIGHQTHTNTYMHIHTYIYTHICIYVRVYMYMYIYIYTYIYMCVCVDIHMYMYICTYAYGIRYICTSTSPSILKSFPEPGCRMICAGVPSVFGLGAQDGHVPTLWLLPVLPSYRKDMARHWHLAL